METEKLDQLLKELKLLTNKTYEIEQGQRKILKHLEQVDKQIHSIKSTLNGTPIQTSTSKQSNNTDSEIFEIFSDLISEVKSIKSSIGAMSNQISTLNSTQRSQKENTHILKEFNNNVIKNISNNNLNNIINSLLFNIGVPPHIKGHTYLKEAIVQVCNDQSLILRMTQEVYPQLATHFKTTPSRIERAIRHAIEVCWNRSNSTTIEELFHLTINKSKPTNTEFINLIVDKIKSE